ncbi:LysR family transcriptional regulator [Mesoterricola sediminis]|uniref:LysR family transcriptional regulator n=1 Tax=Mesoterricola sediminis TaxID=2927980 RepID=UPI001FAEFBFD|nr:LysR family transcriptional regulator [Mesoterricola sediminis]
MDWLNYHHLLYFWTVAREGSVTAAARTLNLSQPALSTQIRALEESLGERLFEKAGRGLRLTGAGQVAFRYADEIFTLGREFRQALKGRPTGRALRLVVGVSDVLPKLMVQRLLRPALRLGEPLHLTCREGTLPLLLEALQAHEVDIVLSDVPCTPVTGPRAFNHLLGECGVELFGSPDLVARHPGPFPEALNGAPFLLPSEGHALRRGLDTWFERRGLHPVISGEFDDSALLMTFGEEGLGFLAAHAAISGEVARAHGLVGLGPMDGLKGRIYAVSAERRLVHPAVLAVLEAAKAEIFL